jgi:hypothetical protein
VEINKPWYGGISENAVAALGLLREATCGRFDINMLAGPCNVKTRVKIMSVLTCSKVPQAKAGITTMWTAFHTLAGTSTGCIRHREDEFMEWAARMVQKPNTGV